ncbi:MAG TPA: hypothetical protein VF733_05325 [Candidatus Saccharimonadales bacterium]
MRRQFHWLAGKNKWTFRTMVAVAAIILSFPSLVSAHQSPGSCNGNRLNVSIIKDKTTVYQGDTLTYTITANNTDLGGSLACDITNASVNVTLPAADGTPTGQVVNIVTAYNFPAGTTTQVLGTLPYVVNVNPGVIDIVAQVEASGTLHDAPIDHSAQIIKTLGTSVLVAASPNPTPTPTPTLPKLPNTGMAREW